MKKERIKKNKKTLKIIESNGFRKPYQILVTEAFIVNMNRIENSLSQLQNVLRDEPKFFVTKCIYNRYKSKLIENDFSGKCEIMKCNHSEDNLNCLNEIVKENNKNHYIVAVGSKEDSEKFKDKNKIPLLKIKNSKIFLEVGEMQKQLKFNGKEADKKEIERLKKKFGKIE